MFGNGNSPRHGTLVGIVSLSAIALASSLGLGCTAEYSRGPFGAGASEPDPDALLPDVVVERQSPAGALRVGFGKKAYTPKIVDAWVDVNGNAKWDPNTDTFTDGNANGTFDAYWLAGFSQGRPAQTIHDDIEAVATVIDDGTQRIAFVALDAIGFMNGEVEDVRKMLPASLGITLLNVSSTHNHEAPDLQGLWGKDFGSTGVNEAHMAETKKAIVAAVTEAVGKLTKAEMRTLNVAQGKLAEYVADTRSPEVFDPDVHVLEFRDAATKAALGRIVNWSNHPEALWGSNLAITADYPGYVRRGIDDNIAYGDEKKMDGLGGVTVFLSGAIGGLLCPRGDLEVTDRFTGEKLKAPSFDKARAIGYGVAASVIEASKSSSASWTGSAGWNRRSRTFEVPATNQKLVIAAKVLKILKRQFNIHLSVPYILTELHLLELGDARFLMMPGELYPEIANGGVTIPEGSDYPKARKLDLPWRKMVPQGGTQFFVGLSNDAIGYIIPKTQWDEVAPYTYGDKEPPYGETNSIGADTGLVLDEQLRKIMRLPVPDRGSEDPK